MRWTQVYRRATTHDFGLGRSPVNFEKLEIGASNKARQDRRAILRTAGALGVITTLGPLARAQMSREHQKDKVPTVRPVNDTPARTTEITLDIAEMAFQADGRVGTAVAINGSVPGPILRLREGEEAIIRVRNRLREASSIHWHGIILPPEMDGVPGVSFPGIAPGEIFTYRFPVKQSGTYWAHSHSGGQELLGLYFPLIIDPIDADPFQYESEHVLLFSDWSFESPAAIIAKLKKQAGYYNYQRRTAGDLFDDARRQGWITTLRERLEWARMRMDPTDLADVTGHTYTYLLNGSTPRANWTGLFQPGKRLRLRLIDAGAMTYFDVRIPDLEMTVVQADGQNVRPVVVKELRIAPGETYDVIIEPDDRAYTVFAESIDRSGYARGTLTPQAGMSAPIPPRRKRALRTTADMGMSMAMAGMEARGPQQTSTGDHGTGSANGSPHGATAPMAAQTPHESMTMPADSPLASGMPLSAAVPHGSDSHGPGNSMVPMEVRARLDEAGTGLDGSNGKVLVYADLQSLAPREDRREPKREIELHITGNMERYSWSFDGKKYSEASQPIAFKYGERLRLILVNDTMMEHPIHLHGMWMELENGPGANQPRKHTVNVKPAERLTVAVTADAPGLWAMHCHLLLHMEMGMFRVIEVSSS